MKANLTQHGNTWLATFTIDPGPHAALQEPTPITLSDANSYRVGAGYGTLTGPRLKVGKDWLRHTASSPYFDTELQVSSVLTGVEAKYLIPGNNPLTDQFSVSTNLQKFTPKNGVANRIR